MCEISNETAGLLGEKNNQDDASHKESLFNNPKISSKISENIFIHSTKENLMKITISFFYSLRKA